jgi:hypothetical protein
MKKRQYRRNHWQLLTSIASKNGIAMVISLVYAIQQEQIWDNPEQIINNQG